METHAYTWEELRPLLQLQDLNQVTDEPGPGVVRRDRVLGFLGKVPRPDHREVRPGGGVDGAAARPALLDVGVHP